MHVHWYVRWHKCVVQNVKTAPGGGWHHACMFVINKVVQHEFDTTKMVNIISNLRPSKHHAHHFKLKIDQMANIMTKINLPHIYFMS